MSDVTARGPQVSRSVSATWTIRHRWNVQLGDVREYHITRSDGDRVTIGGLSKYPETVPADVARQIAEAMLAASDWEDVP